MTTSHEKGTALEAVVSAIEALILETSPNAKEKPARIENRKIVRVNEVKSEIDIYVTIEIALGYTAVFIFECKNWQQKVDKTEIILFSEKIKVCNAQHGYFVAKSFTADAIAQANQDPRMTLKIVTEHDPANTIVPFGFHYTFQTPTSVKFICNRFGGAGSERVQLDVQKSRAIVHGTEIELLKYVDTWSTGEINESMRTFPSGTLPDGDYSRSHNARREFSSGEFVVEGIDVRSIDLNVAFEIHLKRPAVLSHFEVDGRGRVITFEGYNFKDVQFDKSEFVIGPAVRN